MGTLVHERAPPAGHALGYLQPLLPQMKLGAVVQGSVAPDDDVDAQQLEHVRPLSIDLYD